MSPKHPLLLGFQFWFESGKGCRVFICIQIDNSYSKFKKKSNGVFLRIYISRGSGDIFILIKEGRIFGNPMKVVFFKSILCIFWILFYFILCYFILFLFFQIQYTGLFDRSMRVFRILPCLGWFWLPPRKFTKVQIVKGTQNIHVMLFMLIVVLIITR